MNKGKLYGIGIGPGDPELMTLKAVRRIAACDLIAVPETKGEKTAALDIARQAVPTLDEKEILSLYMPMTRDRQKAEQNRDEVAAQILSALEQGKTVAFLTLGDPTIYSTYLYTHRRIRQAGYEAEIIPGVPSFCAAAAALNIGLVEGNEPLLVLPASYDGMEELLAQSGTKVLMKTGRSMVKVKEQLRAHNLYDRAQMVENCGMDNERIYTSMDDVRDDAHYFSVIVTKS